MSDDRQNTTSSQAPTTTTSYGEIMLRASVIHHEMIQAADDQHAPTANHESELASHQNNADDGSQIPTITSLGQLMGLVMARTTVIDVDSNCSNGNSPTSSFRCIR